uniref:Trafficking protein particle complex subunit 2 n=1 Tax=Angiostrongylus cantonensis TaxID=6313 RepID=A0A0K0CUF2_ANGCA
MYYCALICRFFFSHGKPFQYPLTFPIKFCAFDESLCFGPHVTQSDLPNIAYLHVYVIDSASVDEYRTSVRHNVSEWFAKVSSKSDVQWLIIVDSTRAKEKKNRPSLLEKLRHDFSKHTSKLFWSLGAYEHALTLYDELDQYLFEIVEEIAVTEGGLLSMCIRS